MLALMWSDGIDFYFGGRVGWEGGWGSGALESLKSPNKFAKGGLHLRPIDSTPYLINTRSTGSDIIFSNLACTWHVQPLCGLVSAACDGTLDGARSQASCKINSWILHSWLVCFCQARQL